MQTPATKGTPKVPFTSFPCLWGSRDAMPMARHGEQRGSHKGIP